MLFLGKRLDEVTEQDLLSMIGVVHESKTIDFKRELPKKDHKGVKGYLADVSAFANASGGFIIYGMEEVEGVASELVGLDVKDIDEEIRGLNSRAEANIKPRIHNRNVKPIQLSSNKFALIESISKSLISPHVVDFDGHWRFYSRNSNGNYLLEVDEVKSAFLSSETLRERIRSFRMERLANIVAGETPILLEQRPTVVFHIMPLVSFTGSPQLPLMEVTKRREIEDVIGLNNRLNIDGLVGYRGNVENVRHYTQIFRNGIIEHVNVDMTSTNSRGPINRNYLISAHFEHTLIKILTAFLGVFRDFDIAPPLIVNVSLLGFKGYYMGVTPSIEFHYDNIVPLDRDTILVPDMFIEDLSQSSKILRAIIDTVWNAGGWQGSLNYDKDGNWNPRTD